VAVPEAALSALTAGHQRDRPPAVRRASCPAMLPEPSHWAGGLAMALLRPRSRR
jgi:hypothetical protein